MALSPPSPARAGNLQRQHPAALPRRWRRRPLGPLRRRGSDPWRPATRRPGCRAAGGAAPSLPFVVGVAPPGASSPAVRATLETESVDGNGSARLTLDDRDGPAVAGRAVFTLSGGL